MHATEIPRRSIQRTFSQQLAVYAPRLTMGQLKKINAIKPLISQVLKTLADKPELKRKFFNALIVFMTSDRKAKEEAFDSFALKLDNIENRNQWELAHKAFENVYIASKVWNESQSQWSKHLTVAGITSAALIAGAIAYYYFFKKNGSTPPPTETEDLTREEEVPPAEVPVVDEAGHDIAETPEGESVPGEGVVLAAIGEPEIRDAERGRVTHTTVHLEESARGEVVITAAIDTPEKDRTTHPAVVQEKPMADAITHPARSPKRAARPASPAVPAAAPRAKERHVSFEKTPFDDIDFDRVDKETPFSERIKIYKGVPRERRHECFMKLLDTFGKNPDRSPTGLPPGKEAYGLTQSQYLTLEKLRTKHWNKEARIQRKAKIAKAAARKRSTQLALGITAVWTNPSIVLPHQENSAPDPHEYGDRM